MARPTTICPECREHVKCSIPKGGDGSGAIIALHNRTDRAFEKCEGSYVLVEDFDYPKNSR